MRLKGFITFLLFIYYSCSFAQNTGDLTQSRVLILLDASSSMTLPWKSGKIKYNAAKEIILKLMDSVYTVNKDVEFSLRVFGHQYTVPQNNCQDTRNEVPFRKDNRQQMELRLEDIHPLGVTSIAFSLKEAAEKDLVDIAHNAYSIILITDGGESCGGDICAVMRMLIKYKVYFRPYIISLEDAPGLKKEYECMGDYLQVTTSADIPNAVGTIVEAFRPAIRITKSEYKQLQTIAASAPSVLKVNVPPVKIDSVPIVKQAAPPAWAKPAVEVIGHLIISHTQLLSAGSVKPIPKPVTFIPAVPEIKETPVRPAPETIGRIMPGRIKTLNIAPSGSQSLTTVRIPQLPEIKEEHTLPAPETIGRINTAQLKKVVIAPPTAASLQRVTIPQLPEIKEELTRPAPEKIARVNTVQLKRVAIVPPATSNLQKISVPEMPEIKEEPTLPAPEKIVRINTAQLKRIVIVPPAASGLQRVRVPDMPEIKEELKLPSPESISTLSLTKLKTIKVTAPKAYDPRQLSFIPEVPQPMPEPVKPQPEHIASLISARLKTVKVSSPAFADMKKANRTIPLPAIAVEPLPVVLPPPEKLSRMPLARLRQMSVIWVVESHALTPRRVPDMPPIKVEVAKVSATKPTAISTPPPPDMKLMERTMESEEAKETTLEVYFTNGKGRYFATTPQILLLDPTTGNVVKKFYRFVDGNGNPDPQKNITPGIYNLTFAEKPSLVVKNVKIEVNKRNKLTVIIKPTSLSFAYSEPANANARSKRPVTEFVAEVVERNKVKGRIETQKCWEALEYEPGNYHLTINTFPPEVRNVDLDFDEAVIMIQQPGFAKFTGDGKLETVRLFKRVGDKFLQFFELNLRDPQSQHLRIQPGEYQAHYLRGPNGLTTLDKVKMFVIKPTQETQITLD